MPKKRYNAEEVVHKLRKLTLKPEQLMWARQFGSWPSKE